MTILSQEIVWEELPFNKIDEINYDNDSLVDMDQTPFDYYDNNGLIYRVASTDYDEYQKDDWIKEIVNEYLEENQIKDNGKEENKYAITWESDYYELKEHKTEKRYYFVEGSGVSNFTVIKEDPGYIQEGVFCIINDSLSYPNTKFNLKSISPNNEEYGLLKPNQSCQVKIGDSNYKLDYTADFCEGHFQVEGYGTIFPEFYNLKLIIMDITNNKEQIIWKIPYELFNGLHDIEIGDINNDKKQDIVLTIFDELCSKRIIYLSNDSKSKKPFRYIGTMMIHCDYP